MAVLTKADRRANFLGDLALAGAGVGADVAPVIAVSAESGSGLSALLTSIVARLTARAVDGDESASANDAVVLTRERHRIALAQALSEVREFQQAWIDGEVPATIAAVHLRAAAHVLDELVGAISVDDVLDKLFLDFCVGK